MKCLKIGDACNVPVHCRETGECCGTMHQNFSACRAAEQRAKLAAAVPPTKPLTGWSSDYYKLKIERPTDRTQGAYFTECNDIIEALGMSFAEGNAFKALWRIAAKRMGNGKPGTTALYDAEKVAFFGQRLVEIEKARQ